VVVADTAGYSLWYGNNPWIEPGSSVEMGARATLVRASLANAHTHREFLAEAQSRGTDFIRAHPMLFISRGLRKLAWSWGPHTFPLMRVQMGHYAWLNTPLRLSCAVLLLRASHIITLALIAAGAALSLRRDYSLLVVGLVVVTSAGCFVLVGLSRYTFPLMVIGLPLAGDCLSRMRLRPGELTAVTRRVARNTTRASPAPWTQ
jgi:hypothetical protein